MSDLNAYEEGLAIDLDKAEARIEELEANLVLMERKCATLCEGWRISDHARIDGEKKLAKAVEVLEWVKFGGGPNGESYHELALTTLAELKGTQ